MIASLGDELFDIGARLRFERERLALSQEALGTRLGTTGRTIKKYESNETSIRAVELLQLAQLGADILFVVTGERTPEGVAQARSAYSPAEHLARFISTLKLSDEDAELLQSVATRFAR